MRIASRRLNVTAVLSVGTFEPFSPESEPEVWLPVVQDALSVKRLIGNPERLGGGALSEVTTEERGGFFCLDEENSGLLCDVWRDSRGGKFFLNPCRAGAKIFIGWFGLGASRQGALFFYVFSHVLALHHATVCWSAWEVLKKDRAVSHVSRSDTR